MTEADLTFRRLREAILRAEFRPGEVLVEEELTTRLGVGRTPLRDALHRLAHNGLVEIRPRRGTFVSHVTLDDLSEIFEARVAIERAISAVAIDRSRAMLLEGLDGLLKRASAVTGPESDVEVDADFHDLFLRAVRNRYLSETYQRLLDASVRLIYLTGCGMEPPADQRRTLARARDAVKVGDSQALEAILLEHLGEFRDRVSSSLFSGTSGVHARR
jgi:DNA-binding GntR family transcriptional regulator